MKEILQQIESFKSFQYDLIELRIDFYKDIHDDQKKVNDLLYKINKKTNKPLLFTYRSLREGGQIQLTDENYLKLIQTACVSQCIDLVDIELMVALYWFINLLK